jgi:hypothetical protein
MIHPVMVKMAAEQAWRSSVGTHLKLQTAAETRFA